MTSQQDSIFITHQIGPAFESELREANLHHLPLSFDAKGVLITAEISSEDLSALQNLINAHNHLSPDPFLYRELRATAYPAITDQLDEIMKWVASEDNVTLPESLKAIAESCMAIKDAHPKP
jgi:hypothetical protein